MGGLRLWSGAVFPQRGQALLGLAALTNGFTALVSVNEGHDGTQGHVWMIPDALQVADGILDVFCKEKPTWLCPQRAEGSVADTWEPLSELTQGLAPPGFTQNH